MPLKYKTVEVEGGGKAVLLNEKGLPIVINEVSGKDPEESGLDALHLHSKVPALTEEAKGHRKKASALKDVLTKVNEATGLDLKLDDDNFADGIVSWVTEAATATETVKNLKDGDLVKAGEVETIKKQAQEGLERKLTEQKTSFESKIEALTTENLKLTGQIDELMIGSRFTTSEFVKDKLAMTPNMARAYFRNNFTVERTEEGTFYVVGRYPNGQANAGEKIYSDEKPGELAPFDECLQILVNADADRDSLLSGSDASGTGTPPGGGGIDASKNPWSKEHWNLTKQGEIARQNPQKARELAAAAGKSLL